MEENNTRSDRKEKKPKTKKKRRWGKFVKIFLFLFLAVTIIGGGAAAGFIASMVKKAPNLDLNAITDMASKTKVFDSDGQFMFELQGDGERELINSLQDTSPFLADAFVAAEDKNFYTHFGINPYAIARAGVQNLIGGDIVSGASTITQQTIKNAMFPEQERSLERKVQEAALAIQLEQKLTKEEILLTYMNWIYFGKSGSSNLYGVERASKAIFGVPSKDLNLAQATILAALPNNPSLFNPYTNFERTAQRQEYILQEMLEAQFITQAEYAEAKAYDVAKDIQEQKEKTQVKGGEFAHLVAEVETRSAERLYETGKYESLDKAREALFRGGYEIHTTINRKMQNKLDEVIDQDKFYPENISYTITDNSGKQIKVDNAMMQAGATLIDNKTGKILSMAGGRKYEIDQVNHATQPRQPGSTMKPIAVYGPALENKLIGSGSAIDDVPMVWPDQNAADGKYFPKNWDNKFHGLMTVRHALEQSYNIPALKVFHQLTPTVGLDFLKKMGVTTLSDTDVNLAAAIGGLSHGLTVTEATNAFATLPNMGVSRDAYMIETIKGRDGSNLYQHKSVETQVFNPNTSFILTDMLKDVVRKGTATDVGSKFPGYEIAGKTGTTDVDKDSWFVGYTPDVTLGVWAGYNIPYTLESSQQKNLPKTLWNSIMTDVFPLIENRTRSFPGNPGGVRNVSVCRLSGKIPTELCKEEHTIVTEMFIAGTEPTEQCDVHVKAKYYEVGDKKYLANDSTPSYLVKEGIFIKREKYTLPNNDKRWLPLDHEKELPSDKDPRNGNEELGTTLVPTGVKITNASDSSVSLSWNAVSKAKSYLVLRADSEAGPFQIVSEVKTTTFTDTSVQKGKEYAYRIVAIDGEGLQSDPSQTVTVTPGLAQLTPPSGIKAQAGAVGLTISWQQVPGATSYAVYRSTDPSGAYQRIGTTAGTAFDDVGAMPGMTYFYKISSLQGDKESGQSAPVPGTASGGGGEPGQPIQAPTGLQVTDPKSGNSLVIGWNPSKDATSYLIERSTDGATWSTLGTTNDNGFFDSGLSTGQKYFYRIRAIDAKGNRSSPSAVANGTPTQS
ncbi:transglycosylase domain-containing protein [Tumebacillus lipolyticus]|uniref:Transglycosylase domain-containing protein n=1 Tax=Tumebacillus lipolyticus TaxID=1280370 RepID=A0ABW4ZVC6_9BACL